MMNPAVPVIGSKVAVVGSKVTEMLKRKLQQRLMAEKAKKAKTSLSDDEKEPVLPSGSSSSNGTKSICNTAAAAAAAAAAAVHLDMYKMSANGRIGNGAVAAPGPGAFGNVNTFINHINFSSQNGHNQQEFQRTVDTNKNKITKPKNSKSKKTQKAVPPRCANPSDSGAFANTNTNVIVTSVSGAGSSDTATVNSGANTKMEDLTRNCATIMFSGVGVKPHQLSINSSAFANGCYHLHSNLCKAGLTLNGDDKRINLPANMFDDDHIRNSVLKSCGSEAEIRNGSCESLGPVLQKSLVGNCHDQQNSVNEDEKIHSDIDTKIGILKGTVNLYDGNAFQKFHSGDINNKKPLKSEGANSGLIDSSLWPLLYGENSKQLDDYIHRIYCRDCQKSQEQVPLGEKTNGENYQRKNTGLNSEPRKCQLQHHKEIDESLYYPPILHLECDSMAELELCNNVQTSQKTSPLTVHPKDQKNLNVFQDQNQLSLHNAAESVNGSSPESTENSPNLVSTPTEKDSDSSFTKQCAVVNVGGQSIALNDLRSAKAKKPPAKTAPKPSNKIIKFHEYKGPPAVSRPSCTIALPSPPTVRSPPLKDDLFLKLQQRQLCLQMQLQLEFRNHQLMANLAGHPSGSSCKLGGLNHLRLNDPRGPLSLADSAGKDGLGHHLAMAKVSFSPTRTPVLLQSASSLMTSPFKFVPNVNEISQNLTSVSVSFSLPLTTGSNCVVSSVMSTCKTSGTTVASPVWPCDPSSWSTKLVQSDISKIPVDVTKPGNECVRTCVSQNNVVIISSTSGTSSVQSFSEATAVQSTTIAIANAMTSAPILSVGGKLLPNPSSSVTSNGAKAKNSASGTPNSASRTSAVFIPTRLEDVKVADLKAECRKRKLVVSGPKPNLIERLRPYEEDVLRCLSVNMRAAAKDGECPIAEKSQSAVGGDQTSSPSSLTSMDSVVNMRPLCLNHEEESNGDNSINASSLNKSNHAARSSVSSELDFQALDTFKGQNLSSFQQIPSNLGLSMANVSPTGVKSCFTVSGPGPNVSNSIARETRVSPCGNELHLPTIVNPGSSSQESSTGGEQLHCSKPPPPPSAPFTLPSVSQWYRLPQPFSTGSIPVSSLPLPSLPVSLLSSNSFVPTLASSSASTASVQVPNYVVHGTSPAVIPPPSSYMATHSVGLGMLLQPPGVLSPPRFPLLSLGQGKTGNIMSSCGTQSLTPNVKNEAGMKDSHFLSSSNEPSCVWSTGNCTKVQVPPCLDPNGAAPPRILSSSELLNWQQQQIQELQKQLHLSRLQLLETHRRVLEQREQFQVGGPVTHASCPTPSDSVLPSPHVSESSKRLDSNSPCGHMGFEYCNSLPNIPKLNEPTCSDVLQELFEDYNMGISPIADCVRLLDNDVNDNGAEELETFEESCHELLSDGMDDHRKAEEIDHIANSFLSPDYDATNHSMLEMCAMEMDIQTGETNAKELTPELATTELEKPDNSSFYIPVPLKEPPKYDDVIKDKQKSSSVSSSTVAVAANSVDDLLQMLMKQTDVLGHSTIVTDHVTASESDTSPPTFTSPMSHDLAIDELTLQEMDAYPYSAGSNCSSSSGISTAPSTCGDLLNDPLSSSGISSSVFSEIPFQLPDWTDSEFLDLSLLGKIKFDQLDGKPSFCKAPTAASDFTAVSNHAPPSVGSATTLKPTPSSNEYDPCLAGFGPAYPADTLGLSDLLDAGESNLPVSDAMNFSRSFDILDDLFMIEGEDIFQDPCQTTLDRHLNNGSVSKSSK